MEKETLAAIWGAVVGGSIAAIIQLLSSVYQQRQITKSERQKKEVLAQTILFKMTDVHNNTHHLSGHIEEYMSNAAEPVEDYPILAVQGIPNDLSRIAFTSEEKSLIVEFEDFQLLQNLMQLEVDHNDLIKTFSFYTARRSEIQNLMPFDVSEKQMMLDPKFLVKGPLVGRIREANSLLISIRDRLPQDIIYSTQTITLVNEFLRAKMKMCLKWELISDDSGEDHK